MTGKKLSPEVQAAWDTTLGVLGSRSFLGIFNNTLMVLEQALLRGEEAAREYMHINEQYYEGTHKPTKANDPAKALTNAIMAATGAPVFEATAEKRAAFMTKFLEAQGYGILPVADIEALASYRRSGQ